MRKIYAIALTAAFILGGLSTQAQRYVKEIYTDADITVQTNITYGTNIDFDQ